MVASHPCEIEKVCGNPATSEGTHSAYIQATSTAAIFLGELRSLGLKYLRLETA